LPYRDTVTAVRRLCPATGEIFPIAQGRFEPFKQHCRKWLYQCGFGELGFGSILADQKQMMWQRSKNMSAVPSVRVTEFTDWRHSTMQGKVKEDWLQLCEQVAIEQDTDRMIELVRELNRMLEEKEQRLDRKQSKNGAAV
jgi:hypothetical protein